MKGKKGWLFLLFSVFVLFVLFVLGSHSYKEFFDDCTVLERIKQPNGATLEIVDSKCKEGLPHTTNASTIRMTRDVYESPRRDEILRHEQVHLAQKRNLAKWHQFYKTQWDYECLTDPPSQAGISPGLQARLRQNPDSADAPYALWRKRWLFFPVSTAGALRDAHIVVWDIEAKKEVPIPDVWKSFFCDEEHGCVHQFEHPHEISAEMLTTMKSKSPAAVKLFKFYQ